MKFGQDKGLVTLKTVGITLLLIGALLALFPFLKNFYYSLNPPQAIPQDTKPSVEDNIVKKPEEVDLELPENLLPISGRLVIPKLDLDLEVNYGVDEESLMKGPGFYPQSGYPDTGNVSIAGHRNAHGSPFWYLDKLEAGDEIQLYYNDKQYAYKVDSVFITHNRDWSVIEPTDTPALTLTTCHPLKPIGGAYDRLIVRAYLSSGSHEVSVTS